MTSNEQFFDRRQAPKGRNGHYPFRLTGSIESKPTQPGAIASTGYPDRFIDKVKHKRPETGTTASTPITTTKAAAAETARMAVNKSAGRKLLGAPTALKDCDSTRDDISSKYWELFLDLLLVVASSAIADDLQKDVSWRGALEFTLLYLTMINGYTLYTPTLTTRFEDSSLYHAAFLLLPYVCAVLYSALYSSLVTLRAFCGGALVQRLVVVVLLDGVADHMPRARVWCTYIRVVTLFTSLLLGAAMLFPSSYGTTILGTVGMMELLEVLVRADILPAQHSLPAHPPHTRARLTSLVLVTLGETVVTSMVRFQNAVASTEQWSTYGWTVGLCLVVVFAMMLLYVQMLPSLRDDAMNRSTLAETLLFVQHKLLGMALLAVGVGLRRTMEAARTGSLLTPNDGILLSCAVGVSMLLFLSIRLVQYHKPTQENTLRNAPSDVVFLKDLWWNSFFVAVAVPFQLLFAGIHDPLQSAAVYAFLLSAYCVIECSFTQVLAKFLPNNNNNNNNSGDAATTSTDNRGSSVPLSSSQSVSTVTLPSKDPLGLLGWTERAVQGHPQLSYLLQWSKRKVGEQQDFAIQLWKYYILGDDSARPGGPLQEGLSGGEDGQSLTNAAHNNNNNNNGATKQRRSSKEAIERKLLRREQRRLRKAAAAESGSTDTMPVSNVPKTTTTTTTKVLPKRPSRKSVPRDVSVPRTVTMPSTTMPLSSSPSTVAKPTTTTTKTRQSSTSSSPGTTGPPRRRVGGGKKRRSVKAPAVSSSGASHQERVLELIRVLDPTQVDNVDLLLLQFSGREDELIESLENMQQSMGGSNGAAVQASA